MRVECLHSRARLSTISCHYPRRSHRSKGSCGICRIEFKPSPYVDSVGKPSSVVGFAVRRRSHKWFMPKFGSKYAQVHMNTSAAQDGRTEEIS